MTLPTRTQAQSLYENIFVLRSFSFETRFSSIARRYGLVFESLTPHIRRLHQIKEYFDQKAGCDIYHLLGLK